MGTWLKRLSIISLLGFPVALAGKRLGLFDFQIGMMLVAATLLLAVITFSLSAILKIKQANHKQSSASNIKLAMLLSLIPIIGIGSVLIAAGDAPKIHNISTDVLDPPQFMKIKQIRTEAHNPLNYNSEELATVQQTAYPNVTTLVVSMSRVDAQNRAAQIAQDLGWEIIHNDIELGIIEASETTKLWSFVDDVVIRLRGNQADSEVAIDLRSVSRVGLSDLGANAKRIEKFIAAFDNQ